MLHRTFIDYRKFRNKIKRSGDNLVGPIRIGVSGVGRNCGATSIGAYLATFIAEEFCKEVSIDFEPSKVAFVDLSFFDGRKLVKEENTYVKYAFNKRFNKESFRDFFVDRSIEISGSKNVYRNVRWILPSDYHLINFKIRGEVNFIVPGFARIIVYDLGDAMHLDGILDYMDLVIGVVDPLSSKLASNSQSIDKLLEFRRLGGNLIWLVNKMNRGVSIRSIRRILEGGDINYLPMLPPEDVYGSDSAWEFIMDYGNVKMACQEFFNKNLLHKVGIYK